MGEQMADDDLNVKIAVMNERLESIDRKTSDIKERLENDFISKEAYRALEQRVALLEKLNFGLVMLVLTCVGGALLKLVVFK
jgi:vacuolar-type H+-ATPase catalytic subunit A/Vma1